MYLNTNAMIFFFFYKTHGEIMNYETLAMDILEHGMIKTY
jgi:hypothetical protein